MSNIKFGEAMRFKQVMNVFILICAFTTLAATSSDGQLVQRLNYGMYFQPVGHFKPVSDYWKHTFQIVLPSFPSLQNYTRSCDSFRESLKQSVEVCSMLRAGALQSEAIHNSMGQYFQQVIKKVYDIIPEVELDHVDSRSKRSFLPFIGQLSKSLFGTATEKDVEMLAGDVSDIIRQTHKLENAFKYQSKGLASFMTIVDRRITNAAKEIIDNHKVITAMGRELRALEYGLMIAVEISGQLSKQVQTSADLTGRLYGLLNDIGELVQGKISPSLIPPSDLAHMLRNVQNKLKERFQKFELVHKHPMFYYKHTQFLATRHKKSIFITLKVPISAFQVYFKAYKTFSVPVPLNSTSFHGTQVLGMPDIMAMSNDNRYFATMSEKQWKICFGKWYKYCPMDIIISPMTKYSCPVLIFQQMKNLIPTYCNFKFVKQAIKPSIFQLSETKILISNTSHLTLSCRNSWKRVEACNHCVMDIPCQCSVQTENFYMPPMIHSCGNISKSVSKLHPVNLALLQYFHNSGTHKFILGDTLFNAVFDPKLPPIKFYNSHYTRFIAQDKKEHLNLKEVVEATKRNEDIYENSADALLQMFPTYSDSWSITIACLAGASLLTSMTVATGLFLLVRKFKAMSLLILALQNAQSAEGFPVNTVPPQFIYVTTAVTHTDLMTGNFLSVAHIPLSLSTYTIIVIIAVILITYYLIKKSKNVTMITIEITNGEDCVEIPIQKLSLCPSYWHFTAPQYIDNVDVIGSLVPKLTLEWHQKYIFNDINPNKVKLVETKRIDWMTAKKIRKVIKATFCAFIYVRHHGYAHNIQVHDTKTVNGKRDEEQANEMYPCLSAMK